MDIYRNNRPVVFPEENGNHSGKGDRSVFIKTAVMLAVMIASVIVCFASVISANNLVKQYSAACMALQTQLEEASERNEALVEMLEAKLGA